MLIFKEEALQRVPGALIQTHDVKVSGVKADFCFVIISMIFIEFDMDHHYYVPELLIFLSAVLSLKLFTFTIDLSRIEGRIMKHRHVKSQADISEKRSCLSIPTNDLKYDLSVSVRY